MAAEAAAAEAAAAEAAAAAEGVVAHHEATSQRAPCRMQAIEEMRLRAAVVGSGSINRRAHGSRPTERPRRLCSKRRERRECRGLGAEATVEQDRPLSLHHPRVLLAEPPTRARRLRRSADDLSAPSSNDKSTPIEDAWEP